MTTNTTSKVIQGWVGVLCAAFVLLPLSQFATTSHNVVTQFQQNVQGTINVNGEPVDFSGMIHVVVDVQFQAGQAPPGPCRVHTNLSDVVGIGRNTGGTYHAVGATDSDLLVDLSVGLSLETDYLVPEVPPDPCRVFIDIVFDSSGQATALRATISDPS